jgi:hypothetical protein
MKTKLQFNKNYFLLFLILFVVEILIALYVNDSFIRPYVGDLLVVILIYCFIKSFFTSPVMQSAIAVLLFACIIETLQYFNLVQKLGLQHSKTARIIIGSAFEWKDMLAYVAGIGPVLMIERMKKETSAL